MQGRLRNEQGLTFDIQTECGHCGQPMRLEMDGAMNYQLVEAGPELLVFSPDVDWPQMKDPNIIDAY